MPDPNTFFITGCASGIGQHLTDVLLAQGKRVFATDINIEGLRKHAEAAAWPKDRVWLQQLDVRDYAQWTAVFREAVDALKRIDIIINNSGILKAFWCHETPPAMVELMLDVNVKGLMFGTQIAAQHMIEKGGGHIINIASMAGMAPILGQSVYSGSKYAARGFSLAAAQELRKHNVYVTAICPSGVQTPLFAGQEKDEAAAMLFCAPRMLTVQDIEHAILRKAIPKRPLEVPVPSYLGFQARLVNLFPGLATLFGPLYYKRGRMKQQES